MLVEMELREIQISEADSHQIILLGEKEGERIFPIFIGFFEAAAMDHAVRGVKTPRPMTHDLICNILEGLGATLKRILVDELREDTFHGKLVLETEDGREVIVDTRPSDAIVLACKYGAPIFVASQVLDEALGDSAPESQDSDFGPDETTDEEEGKQPE